MQRVIRDYLLNLSNNQYRQLIKKSFNLRLNSLHKQIKDYEIDNELLQGCEEKIYYFPKIDEESSFLQSGHYELLWD